MASTKSQKRYNKKRSQSQWKETAHKHCKKIQKLLTKIRDLGRSRSKWRDKANEISAQFSEIRKLFDQQKEKIRELEAKLERQENSAPPF